MVVKLSLSLPDSVVEEIGQRIDGEDRKRSTVTTTALARWFAVLKQERLGLAPLFTSEECGALIDTLRNAQWLPHMIPVLCVEVYSRGPELQTRWGVDPATLHDKLADLTTVQRWTIVDAVERWVANGGGVGDLFREPAPDVD